MQYLIGVKVLDRKGRRIEGLYTHGRYTLASILTWEQLHDANSCGRFFSIFDSMEECQKEIRKLSDAYYYEFHSRAKDLNVSPGEFGFFALRLNTAKFRKMKFEKVEAGKTYCFGENIIKVPNDFSGSNRYIITSVE